MTLFSFAKKKLKWDEPLGLTTITATLTGSFVRIAPPPSYRRFCYFLSCYQIIMSALFMSIAATKAVTATDFFAESIEALRFLVTGAHILAKHLTMMVREKEFLELIDQIRTAWVTYQPSNSDLLSKTLSSSNKYTVIIFSALQFTLITSVLGAYAKNTNDLDDIQFPLQVWVPASLRTSFVAGTIFQIIPYWAPLVIYCTTISFLNSITRHVEALGLALARDIRRQKKWKTNRNNTLYKKHQEIVRIVHRVNALMASNWGFEMMCSTLQLTLVTYNFLRCLKRNDVEFVNQAFLVLVNFGVIYLIYGNGNRIIQMSEDLHESLCASDWHEASVKERKNLLIMMFKTINPLEYKYKIIHFDLPGFAKVVNTVFSYITILRSVDEMEDKEGS
uniref:Odorant receptor n=1 Tax=Adelphocoris lineolatus TaxID=236346 RepID=A0A2I4PH06_ADELI|nr:olfactory receptor 12 [Adelphocoris lineolatus]